MQDFLLVTLTGGVIQARKKAQQFQPCKGSTTQAPASAMPVAITSTRTVNAHHRIRLPCQLRERFGVSTRLVPLSFSIRSIMGLQMKRPSQLLVLTLLAALLVGCETLSYYRQAVGGHLSLMMSGEAVAELLEDPDTDPELRQQL